MRAAVLTTVNEPLEILEVDVDKPQANEVLIRTAAAGVCHSDMHLQEGKYPTECPIVLGHEGAGVVEAVGSDVRYVQPGDHVIPCVSMSCGECRTCLRGKPYLCPHEGMNRAPDEKPRPAPVRITARTSSRDSHSSIAEINPVSISLVNAFSFSGRFIVMVAMPSLISNNRNLNTVYPFPSSR